MWLFRVTTRMWLFHNITMHKWPFHVTTRMWLFHNITKHKWLFHVTTRMWLFHNITKQKWLFHVTARMCHLQGAVKEAEQQVEGLEAGLVRLQVKGGRCDLASLIPHH